MAFLSSWECAEFIIIFFRKHVNTKQNVFICWQQQLCFLVSVSFCHIASSTYSWHCFSFYCLLSRPVNCCFTIQLLVCSHIVQNVEFHIRHLRDIFTLYIFSEERLLSLSSKYVLNSVCIYTLYEPNCLILFCCW